MGSIVTNVQGNTGGDEATYTIADVAVGGSIQASKVSTIASRQVLVSPDSNACSSTFSSLTRYGLYFTFFPVEGTVMLKFSVSFILGNAMI